VAVQPVSSDGEDLFLICFVDDPTSVSRKSPHFGAGRAAHRRLEKELATTRAELEGAIRNLETSSDEQKQVNQEALSLNEEYQSTNES